MSDTGPVPDGLTVLAVADSDSYVKLSAAMIDALPGERHSADLVVCRSPIAPSPAQVRDAVKGTGQEGCPVPFLSVPRLRGLVRQRRPDVLVLNCTGPVADALLPALLDGRRYRNGARPVVVSALPGVSVPATEKAWLYRSRVDLFVLHSHREVAEFTALGDRLGATGEVGLATLPFLPERDHGPWGARRNRIVFAAQAKVPERAQDREAVLIALADLAQSRPDLEVVVKLRAWEGEAQTHREKHPYEVLWRGLVADGRVRDRTVVFRTGSMAGQLARARGFVTVSSTAALEAIALGVRVTVLTDFGVGKDQINLVFEGSGLFGSLADVRTARFRTPRPEWVGDNYFHRPEENDWGKRLGELVRQARRGDLPHRTGLLVGRGHRRSRRRALLRLCVPSVMLRGMGRLRRSLRALRRRARGSGGAG